MNRLKKTFMGIITAAGMIIFFWGAGPIIMGIMNLGVVLCMILGFAMMLYGLLSLKYPKEEIPYRKDQDAVYRAKLETARYMKATGDAGMRHTVLFGTKHAKLDEYDETYEQRYMPGMIVGREARDVIDRIAAVLLIAAVVFAGAMSAVILDYDRYDGEYSGQTVFIPGCGLKGDRPTTTLEYRLDRGYEILSENPDAVCIVSGGQGRDEIVSESQAMKNYLVEKGIDEDRIYMEDRSEDTEENVKFSKELAEKEGLSSDFIVATQMSQQHRVAEFGEKYGVDTEGADAKTMKALWLSQWCRETVATFAHMIGLD